MKRQDEIAPLQTSFVLSTLFPCPIANVESGRRGSMSPPRRQSSLPPLPPMIRTTSTQPELQNLNPGPMLSQPAVFSYGSLPPMSHAPVAYGNAAVLPPLTFTRPPNSVSRLLPRKKGHRRTYSMHSMDDMLIERPVGPAGEKESPGEPASFMDEYVTAYMELDKITDLSFKDDDVVRISTGDSENGSGSENRRNSSLRMKKGMFTASQVKQIARSEKLRRLVFTDPNYVKRIVSNREAARFTTDKWAKCIIELEKTVHTLEKEAARVTSHALSAQRTKLGLEEENKQIRIRHHEMEEQAEHANGLREYYNGEINRMKEKGTGEVTPNRETMEEIMLMEQLNLDEEPQANYYGFE